MDCKLPGFSVYGIFQARVLEWVAISFSNFLSYSFWNNYNFSGAVSGAQWKNINSTVEPFALTTSAKEAEVEWFYKDLQGLLEFTRKRCPFHYRWLECKSRKSRNTWSSRQIWPWSSEWSSKEKKSEITQACPTLFDPLDCSLPGSSILGIFKARILEWVCISFSRRSSQPRGWTWVSHIVGRCFTVWATREVNEAGQRPIEFCQDNALLISNTLFQKHEKTLHMDITRWSTLKSDWLYSLLPKMEKFYTVSKNKTGIWLRLRSWTPYCQIQT